MKHPLPRTIAEPVAADPSGESRRMPVLFPRRTEGTPPILFLVHGRRGQAHIGTRVLERMCPEQPLSVFQARGVDGVQEPHETINAMAEDYVLAMRAAQPRGPYFVGGLCLGGYVALRMAQILRGLGEHVGPVLLVDPPVPPFTEEDAANHLRTLAVGLRALHRRGDIKFDFDDPRRQRGAERVAASLERALVLHEPVPYDGAVNLLASREKLTATGWGDAAKLRAHFSGPVQFLEVGGRHAAIMDPQNEEFARHLARAIRSTRAMMKDSDGFTSGTR